MNHRNQKIFQEIKGYLEEHGMELQRESKP